ncbi:peroxisomal assembly protein [Serendipita sp. 396]|nr:peroxisomal assembly protein [Serendipita sp. 396]
MTMFQPVTQSVVAKVVLADLEYSCDAQIGENVWKELQFEADEGAIAINRSPDGNEAESLLCWAVKSTEIESDTLVISTPLSTVYPRLFIGNPSGRENLKCLISPITPVSLGEVILATRSESAYIFANTDRKKFEATLLSSCRFVREGETLSLHPPTEDGNGHSPNSHPHQYRVIMTDPVRQGFFNSNKTRIIVVSDVQEKTPDSSSSAPSDEAWMSDEEPGSDLDESFLLSTLTNKEDNQPTQRSQELDAGEKEVTFDVLALHESKVTSTNEYSDITVIIKTTELAKLGVFSGDWVVASNPLNRSAMQLVRVEGSDSYQGTLDVRTLVATPLLLHHLSIGTEPTSAISLRRTSFGQRAPPLPVATSITIARIASQVTVQKRFQFIVFHALKNYFQSARRLLKKGNVLAVPINTSNVTILEGLTENGGLHDNDGESLERHLQRGDAPNEIAYFRVTHIEHDLVQINPEHVTDSHFAAVMGELGCWMDSNSTRLIQGGVENARAPDLDEYLEIRRDYPILTAAARESVLCSSSSIFSELKEIIGATLHQEASRYRLSVTLLLSGNRGTGKRTLARWVAQDLGLHVLEINCYDLVEDTDIKTEGALRARFEQAEEISPSILLLRNIDALARSNQKLETGREPSIISALHECINDLHSSWTRSGYPTFVLGTVRDSDALPLGVIACFKHQVSISAPNEEQRMAILNILLQNSSLGPDISLGTIAAQTAALVADDMVDLVARVRLNAMQRVASLSRTLDIDVRNFIKAGYSLIASDFETGLSQARASFSASIGAPSIPKVSWDDVGGLASVKSDILDTIQLPLQHPELFANGMKKRSGILLFGPPGTGKTLLAKAVATSFSLNFFSVKGPELLNMYIGESEANVRRVFQRARDARPCVIFFDELDSVAPKRGNHGDSGGVMDRIVSQLLAELDGMSDGGSGDVFVIGATNRPDLLDPALLRPGRFDKLLYLGVSDTHEGQFKIIEALTRKFHLDPDLDLKEVAQQCPFNYTGADFYALCSDAMLKAMTRKAEEVDKKIGMHAIAPLHLALANMLSSAILNEQPQSLEHIYPITPQYYLAQIAVKDDTEIVVSRQDFVAALKELVPSVSQTEMEHYRQVQRRFAENKDKGDERRVSEVAGGQPPEQVAIFVASDRKGKGRVVG